MVIDCPRAAHGRAAPESPGAGRSRGRAPPRPPGPLSTLQHVLHLLRRCEDASSEVVIGTWAISQLVSMNSCTQAFFNYFI